MNKKLIITLTVIGSIAMTAGIVNAAATHNVTSNFGPEGDIYQVDGTMKMNSVMIGAQDVGGVTYFNGSIVNDTTSSGADNPVTFGDNVRIDGRVWRGAESGTSDSMPFIVNDNMEVVGSLTIGSLSGTGIVSSDNIADGAVASIDIADGTIATADIANDAITSAKIDDGTIAAGDLANNSITSTKITNGTIGTADIADDAVTPAKINGTGGANLPIAYGYCDSDGSTRGGTSNVTCAWNAGSSRYEITIADEPYYYNKYITVVTPLTADRIPETSSVSDKLLVEFMNGAGGTGLQTDFAFVVYKY